MKKAISQRIITTALTAAALAITTSFASLPHTPENSHAISNNGKYRLDCVAEGRKDPLFKLTDLRDKKVLWSQEKRWIEEAQAIYVYDDGNSVIKNLEDVLVFTTPKGVVTGKVNIIKDGFSSEEVETYVEETTAGPMWGSGLGISYFLDNQGEFLFVVRNWWGGRLVADFDKGKFIAPSQEILAKCAENEKKIALQNLVRALKDPKSREDGYPRSLFGTILMAGQLPCPEAAPLLEKLQKSLKDRDGDAQVIDLALRRLGKKPERGIDRDEKLKGLKVGMGEIEVLKQIGAPEFGDESRWEYDIDAKQPFTLILKWDKSGEKVAAIEKTKEPFWSTVGTRDRQVVDGVFPKLSSDGRSFMIQEELDASFDESK